MWAQTKNLTTERNSRRGFTIVELLIVIVVIGILASIAIVAYNGIQARGKDSQRLSDLRSIQKSLELYKIQNGAYPTSPGTGAAICASHTNGYSYSDATDGSWMSSLVAGGTISRAPMSPDNGCAHHYKYLSVPGPSYNCAGKRTTNYYILQIIGTEGAAAIPSDAVSGTFYPCTGATAGWSTDANNWTFQKDDL